MASIHEKEKSLFREVSQQVESGVPGVEVLALELAGPARFCVYIDHPQGVDIALCERVSGILSGYTDEYGVEVSSPGFERPLRKPTHFRAAIGRQVKLRTADAKKLRGEVVGAGEHTLQLATGASAPVEVSYDAIVRGNLIDGGWADEPGNR